jgi:hypothetical protein
MATRLHTDREILRCIYDLYEADYPTKGDPLLPIEVRRVAERLRCSPDLLFGRLRYDMGTRLRHRIPGDANPAESSIFEVKAGDMTPSVNFPYLSSHLATLEHEEHRGSRTFWLAIAAFAIAICSFAFQIAARATA